METKKKMAGKVYQAPVMESVEVEVQALICASCSSNQVSGCGGGILGYGGGGTGEALSREDSSWDED